VILSRDTIDPICTDRLTRDQARYLASIASRTYGKHSRELPAQPEAWGDSWGRVALGAGLILSFLASAISAGWLRP
jgi:hypothetical protein